MNGDHGERQAGAPPGLDQQQQQKMFQSVRMTPPENETYDSLKHWQSHFRNYFRRDECYSVFLNAEWDYSEDDYGPEPIDNDPLRIDASRLTADLDNFLHIIAGYLTTRIVEDTTSINDVWKVFAEIYNCEITSETLLDFASFKRLENEGYRQLFERMVDHVRRHLAGPNVRVASLSTGARGDTMSISLMNVIAVHWLNVINPQLIPVVKVEYSVELRNNTQLFDLMPRISKNVDGLLAKINSSNVNAISATDNLDDCCSGRATQVCRVQSGRNKSQFQKQSRFSVQNKDKTKAVTCPHCQFLKRIMEIQEMSTNHPPENCPRRKYAIRMMEAAEDSGDLTQINNSICPTTQSFQKRKLTNLRKLSSEEDKCVIPDNLPIS